MNNQKGVIHLVLPLLLLLAISAAFFVLIYFGIIKNPFSSITSLPLSQNETSVSVKSEYKNPFDKKTQYVNPFDQYKSPMLNLKK